MAMGAIFRYPFRPKDRIETAFYRCAGCGTAVETEWLKNGGGMLSSRNNTLVADWVFHTSCWDLMVRENPPGADH